MTEDLTELHRKYLWLNAPQVWEYITKLETQLVKLQAKNELLCDVGSELADLMDDIVDGCYKPDSFTTQPMRLALEDK